MELAQGGGQEVPTDPQKQREHFLVTEPMESLSEVLRKFMATQSVLSTEEILTRITYEAVEDAFSEGIHTLELRYAPTFILHGHAQLSFEKIHRAILEGLKKAKKFPIKVGLICIFQRTLPLKELHRVMDFAIDTKDTWIGVDLADDEAHFPSRNFASLFDRAHRHGFPITVHAGEVSLPSAPGNVIDAIKILGARRIGHGFQIINDSKALQTVIDSKTVLELCPTSNWLTGGVPSLKAHPFRTLMEAGVLTTINSDDPGIFGITLMNEHQLLRDYYLLTPEELNHCNEIAAKASFLVDRPQGV